MADKPKVYEIDNILKGYSDFDKLRHLYHDLREKILTMDPIQVSDRPLITLYDMPREREGNYGWQLYSVKPSLVMLEYFGSWTGYGNRSGPPNIDKEDEDNKAWLTFLRLTIHNSNPWLEKRIEKLIAKYPSDAKGKK